MAATKETQVWNTQAGLCRSQLSPGGVMAILGLEGTKGFEPRWPLTSLMANGPPGVPRLALSRGNVAVRKAARGGKALRIEYPEELGERDPDRGDARQLRILPPAGRQS